MRKLTTMLLIASMLCSTTTGANQCETAKAAKVTKQEVKTVSDGAIGENKTEVNDEEKDDKKIGSDETVNKEEVKTTVTVTSKKIVSKMATKANSIKDFKISEVEDGEGWKIDSYIGKSSEVVIPDEYKGKKIIYIENEAFYGCSNLEKVKLPEALEEMGYSVFRECKNLKEIEIPETVKIIGEMTFYGCSNLEKVKLPEKLEEIWYAAFSECENLKEIEIPETVKIIKKDAFSRCGSLKEIKLPKKLQTLSSGAFSNCNNITKVEIPEGIEEILKGAFENCSSLTEIEIPNSIMEIDESVFAGCKALEKIILPNGLETIKDSAFAGCTSLKTVELPKTLEDLSYDAFDNTGVEEFIMDNESEKYTTIDGVIYNKDCTALILVPQNKSKLNFPETLTSIEVGALNDNKELTTVVLPVGLKNIGEIAFSGCTALEEITLPDTVEYVGKASFMNCISLKKVQMPKGLEVISGYTFYNCYSLTELQMPEILEEIGSYAFDSCESLTKVQIPETVKIIGSGAFGGCTALEEIKLPKGLEVISGYTFSGCKNITQVQMPDAVKKVEEGAFSHCINLTEVQMSDLVKKIEENTFLECTKLEKIHISKSLKKIEKEAFSECISLEEVELPKTLSSLSNFAFKNSGVKTFIVDSENSKYSSLDGVIYNKNCTVLKLVPPKKTVLNLPETVTSISMDAASGNTVLKEVKFSNALKVIHANAFSGCTALKNVVFPNKLQKISYRAFKDCVKITSIIIPASVTYIDDYAFSDCANLKKFQVRSKNKKYSSANNNFYNKNKTIFYESFDNKETIIIPKSVKTISSYFLDNSKENVKKIKVKKGNKYFSSYDNALYNKKMTKLLLCPKAKTSIILPATVKDANIEMLADAKLNKIQVKAANKIYSSYKGILYNKEKTELICVPAEIENIVLPKTVALITGLCGWQDSSITVEEGNTSFQAIDDILYNKDCTEVYYCAGNKKSVILPETVEYIAPDAFSGCDALEQITFPEKLSFISYRAFSNCSKLEYIKLPDSNKEIGIDAFAFVNCSSLKWIYFPKNVSFEEETTLFIYGNCRNLTDVYYAGTETSFWNSWDDESVEWVWDEWKEMEKVETPLITYHFETKAPL